MPPKGSHIAAVLIALVFGIVVGWRVCSAFHPKAPEVTTDTLYVDRPLVRTDTVFADRPTTRIIYQKQTDTVRIEIPVPVNTPVHGVITPAPVRIDGRRVTLTYWQPDSLRWQQDVYQVRRPQWGFGIGAIGSATLGRSLTGSTVAGVVLRRRSAYLVAGYGVTALPGASVYGPSVGFAVLPTWPR